MKDEKQKYEPPRAMRLDDKSLGRGACAVGSSADTDCDGSGSGAESCLYSGNYASEVCFFAGNIPA